MPKLIAESITITEALYLPSEVKYTADLLKTIADALLQDAKTEMEIKNNMEKAIEKFIDKHFDVMAGGWARYIESQGDEI